MPRKPTTKPAAPLIERPKRVIPKKPEPVAVAPTKRSPSKSSTKSKSASAKKSTKKVERSTKPTYRRMIFKALKELGGRTYHSAVAIIKYIESNYPVPESSFKRSVRLAIHSAVDSDLLLQHKSSYRVSAKGKESMKTSSSSSRARKSSSRSKSSSSSSSSPSTDSKKRKRATPAAKDKPKKRTTKNSSRSSDSTAPASSSSGSSASSSTSSRSKKATPKPKATSSSSSSRSVKSRSSKAESSGSSESSSSKSVAKPSGLKNDHMWQYEDNGWKNYDTKASDVVEEVYQGYLANRGDTDVRAVKSGQWEYMVDFMAMKQTNIQHDNHTIRNIRRVPVSSS